MAVKSSKKDSVISLVQAHSITSSLKVQSPIFGYYQSPFAQIVVLRMIVFELLKNYQ